MRVHTTAISCLDLSGIRTLLCRACLPSENFSFLKKSLLQELLVKETFRSETKSARNTGSGTKCPIHISHNAARFLVCSVCHPNGHIQPCPTLKSQWRLLPMAWHLPPSPTNHPELQLSASLCNTILLGKDGFGVEGIKKDDPEVFATTSPLQVSFALAWYSPDFGNAGCVPSGHWEGRLQFSSTLEVSGLSQNFSHSSLTPRDPSGFILFCFATLPMCQVLLGLRCLFWSHSETQQLSWFLGCCATKIPSRASDAIVCVLADLHSHRLEAAPLILQALIHLPFLFLWRRWRVSTCFSGRHCRGGEVG